jgi:flavin reductase (NADH)
MAQIHHNGRDFHREERERVSQADAEKGEGIPTALQTCISPRVASSSTTLQQPREMPEIIDGELRDDAPPVDIRPLMATFPTGVGVITAMGIDGHPWGMTCTSICSVTLEPPTILVCLRRESPTLGAVLASGAFALNLLHDSARPTAELFASGAPDRFSQVSWHVSTACKGPHLVDAAHTIADCQVIYSETVGSHIVVFGEVRRITRQSDALPLLYGLRRYMCWPGGESKE